MYRVLAVNGPTPLAIVMVVLFAALFAWIALSFTSSLAGFFSMLGGGGCRLLRRDPGIPATRTALLMPMYNESPARVMAGLQATWESLQTLGAAADMFDVFILSDTTDPDTWIEEEAAFLALRARTSGYGRIFYRRRLRNTARKSGNIADWVAALRRGVPAIPDSRRRQRDDRRGAAASGRRDGASSRCRPDPDAADHHRRQHIVRAHAAVCRPHLRSGDRAWHRLVAWRRGQLLGPQRGDPHARLRRRPRDCRSCRGASRSAARSSATTSSRQRMLRRAGWAVHMVPGLAGSYEDPARRR